MEEFNNKTYFTLKEASKLFGYSPDYLGFLVRKKKIKGKRTYNIRWQITKKELLTYCKERKKKIKKPHLFNKKLTLKQASRISGYSPDYIGQLLRTEKLKGKRIKTQVSWLVEKQNIENYRDGREERQSNTRKPLSLGFVKIRRKKLILIGRRLVASTLVLIYFISGIAPTEFLLASIGAFFIEKPKTINLYSQLAEGDWQNLQNSQGPPDISPDKDIDSFSESNSAVYQTGPLSLVLKDFDTQEDISNYLFNSAQIKLSFAIGEKETDISIIEEEPRGETTTSTEEQTSFWNKIKQFFNFLLTRIRSIVFKALSIAKAEEEQAQEPEEPEEPQDPEDIEENPPAEEEGQSIIEEDEESPLDQDTWLDEIIEESEEEEIEDPPTEEQTPEQELSGDLPLATSTEEVEEEPPEELPEEPTEEQLPETESLPTGQTTTTETEATTTQEELLPTEETTTSDDVIATSSDEVSEQLLPDPDPEPDPDILPNLDAKVIIYWSLDNENWQILDTISSYPLSNHLNNGYFTYQTPFLTDWQDVSNLQIKFEGVMGGQTNIISYLDSVWITAEYEEQVEEETPASSDEGGDEGQAPPIEEEQPSDEGGGGGGGDEESPLDQDTWLDEIVEEVEEDEQSPEETEEEPPEETEEPEETLAPSDEDGDEEQVEEEEQPSDDESTEGEAEEETEEPEELDEESEEDPEEQPEEEEPEEEQKPTKKLRKIKIKDKDLIFSFPKKDFTSNEEPFFIISTPDLTIEELLNTDKAEEISEGGEDEELPEVEPMATSTIATSTEGLATSTDEIEEEPEEELEEIEETPEEEVIEEEVEEETIEEETTTTTTEPIVEQSTTTEATSTEEKSFDEIQDEQPPEETEEEPIEEEVEEEPLVEETPSEELEEEELTEEEQPEEEEDLTLLEKIKIFFENIILALKQGIQKIVSIIIKIVRQNIPSVKAQAANNLKLTIIQPDGKQSPLTPQITTTYINGKEVFEIKLQKPKTGLQPGLYKLQIEIETPEAIFISEQEFTWGVLAINVNKSIYVPTEQAYIQMAALNEWGHTLCDANLELRIKHLQSGAQVILSTLHGTIKKSGKCGPNNIVDVPDYYAYYIVKKAGTYQMTLKNLDTNYEITDYFEAQNSVLFDVERIGPTRIWPWAPYQMSLKIKSNQDLEGQIIETVPEGFEISNQEVKIKNNGFTTIPNSSFIIQEQSTSSEKNLVWDNINLTQGELLEITYIFDAPDISPYLFLLGPLTFQGNSIQNIENREEQKLPEVEPMATTTLATSTQATTTVLLESGTLVTTTNATGSEVLEAPSDQNGTTTTTDELWRFNLHSLESFTFTFQESRKWQLASDAATLNQHSFIFENDDADNAPNSNSNMEAVNATATDIKKGQRFIARFQLDNTGDPSTTTFKLQYDKQNNQWIDIDYGGAPNINSGASSSDWNATTVADTVSGGLGHGTSLAIGSDGNPVIFYWYLRGTDRNLTFLKCGNPSCTSGNTTTSVDSADVGYYHSIAVGTDGKPMIAYYSTLNGNNDLAFGRCTTGDCTQSTDWSTTTVDEVGSAGSLDPSIAIGIDGYPVISYYDTVNDNLLFAKCTSGNCTQKDDWITTTVHYSSHNIGIQNSIAIGIDGYPVISYRNSSYGHVLFAKCTANDCTNSTDWSTTTVDVASNCVLTALAIGIDGYPVISYYDSIDDNLMFARCTTADCINSTDWVTTVLDTVGNVGGYPSIAIGTDGNPVIAYKHNDTETLKIIKCKDSACSGATSSQIVITVDDSGSDAYFGAFSSIAIGWDGWPVISYFDDDNNDLKVAKMRPLVELQPAWGLSGTSSTPLTSNEAGSCTGGTNWIDGQWYEATTTSNAIPLDTDECTELAFVLDTVEATASTTYRLRLVKEDGTTLDSYSEYPALILLPKATSIQRYSKEAIKTSASSCEGTTDTDYECTKISYGSEDIAVYSSLAIGTDGYPVIAYQNIGASPDALMVTKCSSADCASISITTEITYGGDEIGKSPSLAIGTDGYPVIAYYNSTAGRLMITKCSSPDCTSISTTTEVSYGGENVGYNNSLAIGTDGYPVIAHWNFTARTLLITKCSSADCASISITTEITYGGDEIGKTPSLAIGTDGYPVIAHENDEGWDSLMVTKCSSADCTSASTTEISYGSKFVGQDPSLAIGTDGFPVIAQRNTSDAILMVTKCSSADCTSANTTEISYANAGNEPSIAIGTDGYPVIAHQLTTSKLLITKCSSADCTSANTTRIDYGSDFIGHRPSLAIGIDGYLVVAYNNSAGVDDLMVTKQLGLPKTAISYFNRYIKTDGQIKLTRNQWSSATTGAMWLEASPAIEDGLQYKFDKADYTASQTSGDSSFSNVTSTGGTSTSTPMFVFTDKFSDNTQPLYAKWQGQSTLQASSKSIVLQLFRFGNSSNTTGWVTITEETSCSADSDCVVLGSTTTDLTDFYYPEYKFNDSTGTTSPDYWVFWRVYQKEATGALSPPTLKTDFWVSQNEALGIHQRAYIFENDDGNTVNENSDMSATNTTTTDLKKGQRFVARFQLDNDGSTATNTYKLQYDKQDNEWIDIDYGGAPNINSGASTSDWNVASVDYDNENVGGSPSLAIGTDGYPVIAHTNFGASPDTLLITKCSSLDCTSISTTTEVSYDNEDVGWYSSLAIGTDGYPVIAHQNSGSVPTTLLITKCSSPDCTSISTTTEVSYGNGNVGFYPSLAIGTDGLPVIAHLNQGSSPYTLLITKCSSLDCTSISTTTEVSYDNEDVGWYSSLAIGTDGYPVVVHNNSADTLFITKCSSLDCSSISTTTEVSYDNEWVGYWPSLAIGTDGYPVIAHQNYTSKSLMLTKCRDSSCSGGRANITMTIDDSGSSQFFGAYSSITIGTDGWPVISYYDDDNDNLKVAKMRPLVEIQPAWGLSGDSGDALNATQAGSCLAGTSWKNGVWSEASTTATIGIGANECTELAFVLDTVEATASTTYRLRLVKEDGTLLDSYSEYPALKIVPETQNTLRYSKEAIITSASSCGNTTEYECTEIAYGNDNVGSYSSIAIGTDGYPVVVHQNLDYLKLMVTKCSSADCTSIATTTEINYNSDNVGSFASIAIGTDGLPVIAHLRNVAGPNTLMVTKCSSADCTSIATTTEISYNSDNVGSFASIAIGTDGLPVIAHRNVSQDKLLVTKCNSADCTSITTTTQINYDSDVIGYDISIAIGTDGYPVIVHRRDASPDTLMVTKCNSADCTSIATTTMISYGSDSIGNNPSIAIGTDGYPVIAHRSPSAARLLVTKCNSADCTSIATTTMISYGSDNIGNNPSIAIGTDGYPVIAHGNTLGTDSLMVTKCSSADCTSIATTTEISYNSDNVGSFASIAIGTDGLPVIAHRNSGATPDTLMITKQLGLPKTAISYFNRYIKTDAQIKISRNMWSELSEGPNSSSTCVSDNTVGTVPWTDPTRATSSDSYYAVTLLGKGTISEYLKATDFGFSIPDRATINGIIVEVERYIGPPIGDEAVKDKYLRIVRGGTIGSTERADISTSWPLDVDSYASYGSSTDLWGETWTSSDINSSDFGMAISAVGAKPSGGNSSARIDHVRITVYYEIPALYLESSPAIEDGLQYKFDKVGYTASQSSGDSSFTNVTSTGGTSTSTPMFVFTDKHSTNTVGLYAKWQGQSTLGASDKNIVLQVFRFGNSTNTTGWVTTTEEFSCTANTDCTLEYSTTTDLEDFFYPEYKFNDSTGTTSPDYWTFWRVYQKEVTGSLSPPTLKTDFWQTDSESTLTQRAYIFENDDGNTVNDSSDMSAINTTTTDLKKGQRFVARFQLDNTGTAATNTYKLQYDKQDNQWIDIDYGGAPNINSGASSSDWNAARVDSAGILFGSFSPISLAIGTDGNPVISYSDDTDNKLNFLKCGNPSCTSDNSSTSIDSNIPEYIEEISTAIGTDGYPMISYTVCNAYSALCDDGDVRFAKCTSGDCTQVTNWSTTTVDTDISTVAMHTSIAIGTDGFPVISYSGYSDLNIAKCTTTDCTNPTDWSTTTVDSTGNVGYYTSIAIGTDGFPVISYRDETDDNLNFARCTTTDCTNSTDWSTTTVDTLGDVGRYTSIAIGTDGLPVISYRDETDDNLNFARCTTNDCAQKSDWSTTTVDSTGDVGVYTSIAIGTDGNPVISYQDATNYSLKIVKCKDASCSGATSSQVLITINDGASAGFGRYTSIAIGWDGWPVISYFDDDNDNLKVAKMRPLVELQPAWGLSGTSVETLNATAAGDCYTGMTWTNGKWFEATTTGTIGLGANECTELAFVLDTVEATASTTYRLRLVKEDGTPLDVYVEYPALKIVKESENTLRYSKEAIITSASSCSSATDYECIATDSTVADIGGKTSIAIGADGNPVIAYVDYLGVKDLKVLKCGNIYCTSGNIITTVESSVLVGSRVSLAIGTDGYPIISYYNETNNDLRVLKCGDLSCSSGNTAFIIDSIGGTSYQSIAIGTDGNPVISYWSSDDNDLNIAVCGNPSCTSGNSTTTIEAGSFLETSIAIGTDGNPVISYYGNASDDLKVAKCGDPVCASKSTAIVDSGASIEYGRWSSITIGTDGKPVIAYAQYDTIASTYSLKVAKCGNPACTSGNTKTVVDSRGIGQDVGSETSIAIGTDGNPVISYQDMANNALSILNCNDTACAGGDELITTIDDPGTATDSGNFTSITIGIDGLPVISYFDDDSNDLKVAKQLGLPKTAISYFNRYIKTDGQIKLTRNGWPTVAATQGPNSPSLGVNDDSYGDLTWGFPDRVYTDNGLNATRFFEFPDGGITRYLKATGFGFSIPDGAIINGITVEVERNRDSTAGVMDSRVRIVKGDGTIGSTDKASGDPWPTTEAYKSYGGTDDLWDESWEYSDINSSDFGMVISAKSGPLLPDNTYGWIDHIRITVDYTAVGGALYLEASPAIEDGLLYKADKAGYTAMATDDTSYDNITSTGGASTSTPMFVFADRHSSSTRPIYTRWKGQSTLGASDKNIVLQIFRFGNSSNTTGWVTTTIETSCSANTDCTIEYSTNTDLTDFYYPEYKFNDSTGTTSAYYWTFWRIYQKEVSGGLSAPTLKTDIWQISDEPLTAAFIKQYHVRWRNDDGGE